MPESPAENIGSATSAQVKEDIDRGKAADKVDHFDPAVAPLGTDEEAAGTTTPPDVLAAERWRQRAAADHATRDRPANDAGGARGAFGWPLLLLIGLIAAGILAAVLFH